MRRLNLIFVDTNPTVYQQWQAHYQNILRSLDNFSERNEYVHYFYKGSINQLLKQKKVHSGRTAVMTPTNSLSYMGGGFDKFLLEALLEDRYRDIKTQLQTYCLKRFNGYTPVNTVNHVNLLEAIENYAEYPAYKTWTLSDMVCIPSMVVPEAVTPTQGPTNIFDTIWNLLLHLEVELPGTQTIIMPGIGTGYGNLDTSTATYCMLVATFLFNLDLPAVNLRLSQLKKSLMILFLFNKDYKSLMNSDDLQELEKHILTEYGASKVLKPGEIMSIGEIIRCIQTE